MQDRPGRTLLAVTAGYFLIMFAVSPVSVVLPSLAQELGVRIEWASWVMTAYLLPLTALLLPAGRLGDMVGHRRVFAAGLALSTLAAAAAGASSGLWPLLAARAVQGLGAALVSAASLPIITAAAAPARRGRAIGLAVMASSLGAMAGTALAPFFVEALTWRWAFYSGAAAGVVGLALTLRMGLGRRPVNRTRLDWPGATLLLLTLVAAALSLNHFHDGPETFSAGWRWHLPMHAAALALLAMFVAVERRVRAPLIRLDQLANAGFTTAIGANGVLHMTMMMASFSMPFLVQRGLGLSALQTGALLVTMQACTTGMTLVAGWVYDRLRAPWLCAAALGMVASGLTALGLSSTALDYRLCFVAIVCMGIGSGAFQTTNNTRIMSALAAEYRGFASGMLETTRQYGHTLGVAVAAVGLAAALGSQATDLAQQAVAAQQAAVRAGFAQSALLMAVIAWAGVALAAYPLLPSRRRAPLPALALPGATPGGVAGVAGAAGAGLALATEA